MINAIVITKLWTRFASALDRRGDRGASLVEYALLVAFIAIICVAAVTVLGTTTSKSFASTSAGFPTN